MSGVDILAPALPNGPSEWAAVDAEVLASLRTPTGILTVAQHAALRRIWGRRWFLIRNNGPLGRARCVNCRAYHEFLTLRCQPRPFNGLTEVVALFDRQEGRDRVIDAIALGTVVPITRDEARRFYGAIRLRGGDL